MVRAIAFKNNVDLILELGKFRIAQLVTLSTATGYIAASGRLTGQMLIPVLGILLLALGSGALNQYQEREADAKMPRTRRRPIPSGRISPAAALEIALGLMAIGALVLLVGTNFRAFSLGVFTAFWYNGVYTYLKRQTALAAVPGSLIGALPPMVGWVSAGGRLGDSRALALAILFFIWQIPHFWLLLLNFGDDYEKAGYPTLTRILSRDRLARLTFVWIMTTAVVILLLPLYGFGHSTAMYIAFLAIAAGLILNSLRLLRKTVRKSAFRVAFHGINAIILVVMFLISLHSLIGVG